jgi:hypothetical protein
MAAACGIYSHLAIGEAIALASEMSEKTDG